MTSERATYQRPTIVRREQIRAVLGGVASDTKDVADTA